MIDHPSAFIPDLIKLQHRNKYAKSWKLEIVRKINKHPETDGSPWGWYEIFPLDKVVGYWGKNRDDLRDVDIVKWNHEAEKISV